MEHITSRLLHLFRISAERVYDQFVANLPQIGMAIGAMLLGLLIAWIAYLLCRKILDFFAVDKLVAKTPLAQFLRELGLQRGVSQIFSLLIFWMIILFTLVIVSEWLHLQRVTYGLSTISGYIPQLIVALLIVIVGLLLARFLELLVTQWVARLSLGYEQIIAKIVYVGVLICVVIAAFEQAGLEVSFLTTNVLTALFVLLVIAAFGLMIASRVFLENVVACLQLRSLVETGHEVDIGGVKGRVEGFTMTSVIIHSHEKDQVIVPASSFLTQNYTICWESDDAMNESSARKQKRGG